MDFSISEWIGGILLTIIVLHTFRNNISGFFGKHFGGGNTQNTSNDGSPRKRRFIWRPGNATTWALGLIVAGLVGLVTVPFGNSPLTVLTWTAAVGYVFFGGLKKNPDFVHGVPRIFGILLSWIVLPMGLVWWLPWPFGSIVEVNVGKRILDRRRKNVNTPDVPGTIHVFARGNIDINASLLAYYRVVDEYTYLRTENADEGLEALITRNARWYADYLWPESINSRKSDISKYLAGKTEDDDKFLSSPDCPAGRKDEFRKGYITIPPFHPDTHEALLTEAEAKEADTEFKFTYQPSDERISDTALDLSFAIDQVVVDDFDLPKKMVAANIEKRVEKAEQISEKTDIETFVTNAKYVIDELDLDKNKAADIAQSERGKATRIIVEGNAGDFTKGAGVEAAMRNSGGSGNDSDSSGAAQKGGSQ